MNAPAPQPTSPPPAEKPERRWTDRSFLPPLFRDLGVTVGVAGMVLGAVYWGSQTQARAAYSDKVFEDLRQEIRDSRKKDEEQDEKMKYLPGIEKWVACQDKAADMGRKYNFHLLSLECIPDESLNQPAPPGNPSQP